MRIPRAWIEAYSRSLNGISETSRSELEARLAAIDWTQDVSDIREQALVIMQACCGASATMAARLAADFYDGLRVQFGINDGFRAVVDSRRDPKATEGAVRAFVQDLVDGKPVETFVGKCSDRVDRETRLAANQCVEHNAKRDPKKPRWARVPTGHETCEFCIMLASRGFKYHTEDLASHSHPNCDCRAVPSWDKDRAEVEGYDPAYYLDCYRHPEAHPEIREAINARRRESRVQTRTASEGDTREKRIRRRIEEAVTIHEHLYRETPEQVAELVEEIERAEKREWEMGYRKTDRSAASYRRTYGAFVESFSPEGRIKVENFTRLEAKELQLAQWLANAGCTVEFRNADAHNKADGKTTDVLLDGVMWEFKRSESKSIAKMTRLITERLDRQGPKFVLDLCISRTDRDSAIRRVAELLEDQAIDEILVVRDGKATLYKK